jgi:hypothetical protein
MPFILSIPLCTISVSVFVARESKDAPQYVPSGCRDMSYTGIRATGPRQYAGWICRAAEHLHDHDHGSCMSARSRDTAEWCNRCIAMTHHGVHEFSSTTSGWHVGTDGSRPVAQPHSPLHRLECMQACVSHRLLGQLCKTGHRAKQVLVPL